ncbi:MAG: HlyD family type I secretion periplasmic adaptor subunit [Cohaesibacter sp.]|jgi:HlyD family type I secretion membrane fusion protein|nr:HlyD family type I secretion periplasmic adaptor subunit [Cohaesibacter sp.]
MAKSESSQSPSSAVLAKIEPVKAPVDHENLRPYNRQSDRIAKRSHRIFTYVTLAGLAAFLGWASFASIERVTRGSGRIVPLQQNQMVQHLEGGIMTALYVKEGDRVKKGDILLRIQNNFFSAELSQTKLEHKARLLRMYRLSAEIRGLDSLSFPQELASSVPELVENELALFERRRETQAGQLKIFDDQIRQKELELAGHRVMTTGKSAERALIQERVESNRRLVKVGAVSKTDLLQLETSLAQIDTYLNSLKLTIPKTEAALSEIRERRQDLVLRTREAAANERNEVEVQLAKLQQAMTAMKDRSQRSDVRAPIAGTVNSVFVSTVGGVVRSGQNLVQIVPTESSVAVEARLSPKDRAEIWPGLPGIIKISAYDYSIHGGLKGKITEISPDALQDKKGQPYFRVRLEADVTSFGADKPVVPGMIADVDILTGERTILNYLLAPIRRLQERALRQ